MEVSWDSQARNQHPINARRYHSASGVVWSLGGVELGWCGARTCVINGPRLMSEGCRTLPIVFDLSHILPFLPRSPFAL